MKEGASVSRKTHTLTSLGISVALIAVGIWLLNNHHYLFGYGRGNWVMPRHMMMGGGGMGMIMILFWVAVLAAIVLLVSGLMTRSRDSNDSGEKTLSEPGALEILKRRYASGEIDKSEYDAIKQDLQ